MLMSEANKVVTKRVDFETPFGSIPAVMVNANSAAPNGVDVTAGLVDVRGFTVYLHRPNNVDSHIAWVAVG